MKELLYEKLNDDYNRDYEAMYDSETCEECGDWWPESELTDGICPTCIELQEDTDA